MFSIPPVRVVARRYSSTLVEVLIFALVLSVLSWRRPGSPLPTRLAPRDSLRSLRGLMHDGIVEWQAPAIKLDELLAAAPDCARRANHPFPCPALRAKIFRFTVHPNQNYIHRCPVPLRGAFRERHGRRGGMRWTQRRARRAMQLADGEVVWS